MSFTLFLSGTLSLRDVLVSARPEKVIWRLSIVPAFIKGVAETRLCSGFSTACVYKSTVPASLVTYGLRQRTAFQNQGDLT